MFIHRAITKHSDILSAMKTVILVGIPGCGKSSIIKETLRQAPQVHVVNYGDQMLQEAALEGLDRDQLRKLPLPEQRTIGIHAAERMVKHETGIVLIDTHALIRTPNGYIPGLPKEVLEILSPRALAWIECSPLIVMQRRAGDHSRSRDKESVEELALHQELSRAYLAACSVATGAVLCCIDNSGPSIEQNTIPLIRLIQSL
jgi:adenylate kinase